VRPLIDEIRYGSVGGSHSSQEESSGLDWKVPGSHPWRSDWNYGKAWHSHWYFPQRTLIRLLLRERLNLRQMKERVIELVERKRMILVERWRVFAR
jgi:hypothetical protein